MNTRTKLFTAIGIAALLFAALAISGWFVNSVYAQGPWQGGCWGIANDNQAVVTLLKTNQSELLQQRQQGKSWLDIAAAQGVSAQALTDALLQPVTQMSSWMTQQYPQFKATQMTEWMRQQIAQDLRVTQFGTMTDMHVFGGNMMGAPNGGAMMENWNGYGGMMGNWNGYGGMMGNWNGYGGMMGGGMMSGWNTAPSINATPVPSTQKVDREIALTTRNFQFDQPRVTVKAGETVKFTIANQDNFAHNAVSQVGKLAYTSLPANQTTSIVWVAPNQAGTYTVVCTFHPGMQFQIVVE